MRFLVVNTPKHPVPPEHLGAMIEVARAWRERYSDNIETMGVFPAGGGFGIAEVPDEGTLHRMLAEMPFTPFGDVTVRAIVDEETGWSNLESVAEMMLARMS